jgi:hypothetical protein
MEQKFERIREVLGIFGEDAFYSIAMTNYEIRFQGNITRKSVELAEDAGYIKESSTSYITYKKDKNVLIFA